MNFKYVSEDVMYSHESIIEVDAATVAFLKSVAQKSSRRQSRLCTHINESANVHEMLIVHEKDIYVRPHKHLEKSESFHVIEGEIDIVLFDDKGAVTKTIKLGEFSSGNPFYYRFNQEVYHTVLIKSPVAVFHETTSGPFDLEDTVYANWAPGLEDKTAISQYQIHLMREVENQQRVL
jgi:cupin fold WbuC family metalloprotein